MLRKNQYKFKKVEKNFKNVLTWYNSCAIIHTVEINSTKEVMEVSREVYDYSKLKGKIKEVFGTQEAFANSIGLSSVSVSNKLNNIIDWRQEEMEDSIEKLKIPFSEIHIYFFTKKVENNSTIGG